MLVKRSDKLAFFGVKNGTETVFSRMTNFTDMSMSKNPQEYSRRYIDEDFERSDVTGYSPSISYAFDRYSENTVHKDIVSITDSELVGSQAIRDIVIVDMTADSGTGTYSAIKRSFSVIPDSEGDSADAYTYSGTFKTCGEKVFGTAKTTDDWKTITFTQGA